MNKRKSDEAYAELRSRIMMAILPPNAVLDEKRLTEDLSIGRTPLREAVLRLEQEGLVVSMGRRGYVVASATPADLMRAYELRRELECFTAGLAAERRGPEDLAKFDAFLARMEAEMDDHREDVHWQLAADEEFHRIIADASDNRFAKQYLNFLFGLSVRSLYVSRVPVTLVQEEIDNYRSVLTAIRMRDVAAASAAMGRHLTINPMQAMADSLSGSRRQAL
ncbi:GntR family transcriptional regulator [Tabrizicola sp. J26]|uniref:GntR family transcriptional regulator n=1 Tax=Alitabrizicola rongguiensis TaxID=2909234 RepID=UPI001F3109A1|nr:GntR family transcriptional regulator [Tabrizicola rongguiensis]MCF1709400.1 GntR family transcriptional regulator [Tabrizicola rongguiensis]